MARPQKVYSNESGEFKTTVLHNLLMCSNVMGNNNKFYSLELQKTSSDDYRLFSHYGRINGDNIKGGVYEIRTGYSSEFQARRDFDKIVKSKQKGKKKVGSNGVPYQESYKLVDVISSSVGSSNVKNNANVTKKTKSIDTNVFKSFGKKEFDLLKMLEEENIHEITNATTITYSGGGLQTPLGPLTFDHLHKAKKVLDNLNQASIASKETLNYDLRTKNNEYLSLIPRNFGRRIQDSDLIVDSQQILREYDLLNQMETAINIKEIKDDKNLDLGFNIEIAPRDVFNEVKLAVDRSRQSMHNLNHLKVKQVYQIENYKERKTYESFADKLQREKPSRVSGLNYKEIDLFHGSKNSNVLSILMSGFYVPPTTASHVTGRMFGNGVYGADASTKALNYATGFWGGNRNKNKNYFCFVSRFAMGKVYETRHSLQSGTPRGYNSIFASGGADLKNNEYIVPNTAQTTITYLVEFA